MDWVVECVDDFVVDGLWVEFGEVFGEGFVGDGECVVV